MRRLFVIRKPLLQEETGDESGERSPPHVGDRGRLILSHAPKRTAWSFIYIEGYMVFRFLSVIEDPVRFAPNESTTCPGRPAVRGFISGVIGTNPAAAQTNRTSLRAAPRQSCFAEHMER
jgi:hypothetical protein